MRLIFEEGRRSVPPTRLTAGRRHRIGYSRLVSSKTTSYILGEMIQYDNDSNSGH